MSSGSRVRRLVEIPGLCGLGQVVSLSEPLCTHLSDKGVVLLSGDAVSGYGLCSRH